MLAALGYPPPAAPPAQTMAPQQQYYQPAQTMPAPMQTPPPSTWMPTPEGLEAAYRVLGIAAPSRPSQWPPVVSPPTQYYHPPAHGPQATQQPQPAGPPTEDPPDPDKATAALDERTAAAVEAALAAVVKAQATAALGATKTAGADDVQQAAARGRILERLAAGVKMVDGVAQSPDGKPVDWSALLKADAVAHAADYAAAHPGERPPAAAAVPQKLGPGSTAAEILAAPDAAVADLASKLMNQGGPR
jgi:hypothetical protein